MSAFWELTESQCAGERWRDGVWVRINLSLVILFAAQILILTYLGCRLPQWNPYCDVFEQNLPY